MEPFPGDVLPEGKKRFTVGTYNILGPHAVFKKFFRRCPNFALFWDYRKYKIVGEIAHANFDVVCMQECEYFDEFLEEAMKQKGYKGIYRVRPTRSDGCAIFWKKNKFKLVKHKAIDFNQIPDATPDMRQNCIGLLALLKMTKFDDGKEDGKAEGDKMVVDLTEENDEAKMVDLTSDSETEEETDEEVNMADEDLVCIATTHIYWKPTASMCKLKQVHALLHETHEFTQRHPTHRESEKTDSANTNSRIIKTKTMDVLTHVPFVLCGDFNISPQSGIYDFITNPRGTIDLDGRTLEELGHRCDGDKAAFEEHAIKKPTTLSGSFFNPFRNLNSAYSKYDNGREPALTTFADRHKGTLDYLFYHPSLVLPTKLLSLPSEETLTEMRGLPNPHWGSDHLLLGSEFYLK